MKILVDTHIAMWSVFDTDKLPKKARDILRFKDMIMTKWNGWIRHYSERDLS